MDLFDPNLIRAFGAGLATAGMGLRVWGFVELRKVGIVNPIQFAQTHIPREPAGGIYKMLNHPMYLGAWMVFAGLGLAAWGEWAGAALVLPTIPYHVGRIIEENIIMSAFRAQRMREAAARDLFEEMSQFGTEDEPSHEAHSEENE